MGIILGSNGGEGRGSHIHDITVADLAMVPWVPWNPPFGLELLLRNTDDEPYGTLLSG